MGVLELMIRAQESLLMVTRPVSGENRLDSNAMPQPSCFFAPTLLVLPLKARALSHTPGVDTDTTTV